VKMNQTIAIALLLSGLLAGCQGTNVLSSVRPLAVNAAPALQPATTCTDDNDMQDEAENEADDATEAAECEAGEANEASEANEADDADDAGALQGQTGISADQAQAIVEATNPGANTLAVELDRVNENGGAVIYEIELDNGLDVQVDAANGNILNSEQRDAD